MHTDINSEELIIMNKKPVENPKYVLEADPDKIDIEKEQWEADQQQIQKKIKRDYIFQMERDGV